MPNAVRILTPWRVAGGLAKEKCPQRQSAITASNPAMTPMQILVHEQTKRKAGQLVRPGLAGDEVYAPY